MPHSEMDLTVSESVRALEADEHGHESHAEEESHSREWLRAGFVALVILFVWSRLLPRFHGLDVVAFLGILPGGLPVYKDALSDLWKGQMTKEISMTIALSPASVIGAFFTALLPAVSRNRV